MSNLSQALTHLEQGIIRILGSLWEAEAEVIKLDSPHEHTAATPIFLENTPRTIDGQELLLPHTVVATCFVRSVNVHLRDKDPFIWKRPTHADPPPFEDGLQSGDLARLLLAADFNSWEKGHIPVFTCLAGEVDLMQVEESAAGMELVGWLHSGDRETGDLPTPPVSRIFAYSSGLAFNTTLKLPWYEDTRQVIERTSMTTEARETIVPYLLTPCLPVTNPGSSDNPWPTEFVLAVDNERLEKPMRATILDAWKDLARRLKPQDEDKPVWATLEITDPDQLPLLIWKVATMRSNAPLGPLQLDPGQLSLTLCNQRLDTPHPVQISVARIALQSVELHIGDNCKIYSEEERVRDRGDETDLCLRFNAGDSARLEHTRFTLSYDLERHGKVHRATLEPAQGRMTTSMVFDPIRTPAKIRDDLGQLVPTWTPPVSMADDTPQEQAEPLSPAVIWAASPLADGWLQLPVPNLTEWVYAGADLIQMEARTESASRLLQGAVVFDNVIRSQGNDPIAAIGQHNGPVEQPWSITLLDGDYLEGRWLLKGEKGHHRLTSANVKIANPELILDGFFWLSSDRPTAADSLPNFDNWVNCLYSVPLRTRHAGLPLSLPATVLTVYENDEIADLTALLGESAVEPNRVRALGRLLSRLGIYDPHRWLDKIESIKVVDGLSTAWEMLNSAHDEIFRVELITEYGDAADSSAKKLVVRYREGCELIERFRILRETTSESESIFHLSETMFALLDAADIVLFAEDSERRVKVIQQDSDTETSASSWFLEGDDGRRCRIQIEREQAGDETQALRFVKVGADPFPSLAVLDLEPFGFTLSFRETMGEDKVPQKTGQAILDAWKGHYRFNERVVARMQQPSLFLLPEDLMEQVAPLAWLRHPVLPMVQAMPMTQDRLPADYPSSNRQLAPFRVKQYGEGLIPLYAIAGARDWPQVPESHLEPDANWCDQSDLSMVSLSIPGLIVSPNAGTDTVSSFMKLPYQYRYDLPYTDELHSLARLPEPPSEVVLADNTTTLDGAPPLTIERYSVHWQRLNRLAALAALDVVEAFDDDSNVHYLVEPLVWPVASSLADQTYPGVLHLKPTENGGTELALTCTEAAVRGVQGHFNLNGGTLQRLPDPPKPDEVDGKPKPYVIEAGSMASHLSGIDSTARISDQRGLSRGVSTVSSQYITTPVELEETPGRNTKYTLVSMLQSLNLVLDSSEHTSTWHFWFRDLPVAEASGVFERPDGANDPEALSRLRNFRSGYEWRLAESVPKETNGTGSNGPTIGPDIDVSKEVLDETRSPDDAVQPLKIFHLDFYPLSLKQVEWSPGDGASAGVTRIEVIGRLQLPLANRVEQLDLNNVVSLIFKATDNLSRPESLTLDAVVSPSAQPADEAGIWPLSDDNEPGAAVLLWTLPGKESQQSALEIGTVPTLVLRNVVFKHRLFGIDWAHTIEELRFSTEPPSEGEAETDMDPAARHCIHMRVGSLQDTEDEMRTIRAGDLNIILNLQNGKHSAELDIKILLERAIVVKGETPQEEPSGYDIHVVQWGDTLSALALRYYGDVSQYLRIFEANQHLYRNIAARHRHPDFIREGWKLRIPKEHPPLPPLPEGQEKRVLFESTLRFDLLTEEAEAERRSPVQWRSGAIFGYVDLEKHNEVVAGTIEFRDRTVELHWQKLADHSLSVLPGMELESADIPGFAVIGFEAFSQPDDLPRLNVTHGFLETLLHCRWGKHSQSSSEVADTPPMAERTSQQIFDSSAGTLSVGYSASWLTQETDSVEKENGYWEETILLNGVMEATNLISWPFLYNVDDKQKTIRLPSILDWRANPTHIRHTIRVLFNQHTIDPDLLIAGECDVMLRVAPTSAVQFLAVVEHQLSEVDFSNESKGWLVTNDRHWTTVQEIRLAAPRHFAQVLHMLREQQTFDSVQGPVPIPELIHGYLGQDVIDAMIEAASDEMLPADTLIIEASTPLWLPTKPVQRPVHLSQIQLLPRGMQVADLSGPEDYLFQDQEFAWILLVMPFVGRLQPAEADQLVAESKTTPAHCLQIDPVCRLHTGGENLPALVLALANVAIDEDKPITYSVLHKPVNWSRLDPASVEEGWFRLQTPPEDNHATNVTSIMAARPDTAARLSRPEALRQSFETVRTFYHPDLPRNPTHRDQDEPTQIVWRPNSYVVNGGISDQTGGWHLSLLPLMEWWEQAYQEGLPRYVAAALLPARPGPDNPMPVSLTISPYLSFDYLGIADTGLDGPGSQGNEPKLVSSELLGIDATAGLLRPVTSRVWEICKQSDVYSQNEGTAVHETFVQLKDVQIAAQSWAKAIHQRLCPDSPVAILRFRTIYEHKSGQSDNTSSAKLSADYSYAPVSDLAFSPQHNQRVFPLRSQVKTLCFRDGQWGGQTIPSEIASIELAPPQVNHVEPIYITDTGNMTFEALPWGLSSLYFSLQYTSNEIGVVGETEWQMTAGQRKDQPVTLWWQTSQHLVQYRSGLTSDLRPVAGLPELFRAKSIPSLLPVIAQPPMPKKPLAYELHEGGNLQQGVDATAMPWQPVLPGSMALNMVGNRSGAMLAVRNQVLTQHLDMQKQQRSVLVSGSVPIQHRMPRPVPLPVNQKDTKNFALRPWASYFKAEQNLLVTAIPTDEAFFAPCKLMVMINAEGEAAIKAASRSDDWDKIDTILTDLKTSPVDMKDFQEKMSQADNQQIRALILKHVKRDYSAGEAQSLRISLIEPTLRAVGKEWNGRLTIAFNIFPVAGDPQSWRIKPSINVGGEEFLYLEARDVNTEGDYNKLIVVGTSDNPTSDIIKLKLSEDKPAPAERLSSLLKQKHPGDLINVRLCVQPEDDEDGFWQELIFPLRLTDQSLAPLPLEPHFIRFEDPEYNRSLATPAAKVTLTLEETISEQEPSVMHTVTLAADRRKYNAENVVALRYDWDDERSDTTSLSVARLVGADIKEMNFGEQATWDITAGKLCMISLSELKDAVDGKNTSNSQHRPIPGDVIQFTLHINPGGEEIQLELPLEIVAEPVNPAPKAAYALLHEQSIPQVGTDNDGHKYHVECSRFAWGPLPARIELICPKDLQIGVVRRRAVFQWQVSERPGTSNRYAIQKISQNGSTFVPELDKDFVDVSTDGR